MVDRPYREPPENENIPLASFYGIVYVLGIIPLWHRLGRILDPVKTKKEWAGKLAEYGYTDPERLANITLWLIDGVCLLGFVGAAAWFVIHFGRRQRWAMLPVLWLSGTMLLYQNLNALYLFYPARPKYINMHHVFWVMFALMAIYAAFARPRPVEAGEIDFAARRTPVRVGVADGRRGVGHGDHHLPRRAREQRPNDEDGRHALAGMVVVEGAVSRGALPGRDRGRVALEQAATSRIGRGVPSTSGPVRAGCIHPREKFV